MVTAIWPKISIVTPSYNQAQYLTATIESIISQNYPNLEYIIIDGGSTDGSVEIIKRYEKQLSFWVSEKDKGQADALVKGFSRATGQIYGFVNSDDILAADTLNFVARQFIADEKLSVLIGAGGMIDSAGQFLYGTYPLGWNKYILLSLKSRFMQPAVFYKGDAYHQVKGINPDFRFCFDLEFFLRLAAVGGKHKITYQKLAFTRLHPLTKTAGWQHISQEESRGLRKKYGFRPSGLKLIFLTFAWRLQHFLLRCSNEGIGNTIHKRSRAILLEQHKNEIIKGRNQ